MEPLSNPCLHCGACCAFYRVSFYWSEADPDLGGVVPSELAEKVSPFLLCMKGTNQKKPRCVALEGEIGAATRCSIYANRPSPCQEFGVQWQNGQIEASEDELARCNHSRQAWGLPPLPQAVLSLPAQPPVVHPPRVQRKYRRLKITRRHHPPHSSSHPLNGLGA